MSSSLTILLLTIIISLRLHPRPTTASDPDPVQDFCIPEPRAGPILITRLDTYPCKNSSAATPDDFVFSGIRQAGNFSESGFASVPVNPTRFPGLNTLGMSFVRADLKTGAVNPPHYHPRATEIAYVVEGRVYSGFVDSGDRIFARVIGPGEVMVYPRGLVHFQMNVGKSTATVFGSFNSQNPGTQKVGPAVFGSGIKEGLLKKVFGSSHQELERMRRRFAPKGLGK